MKPELKQQYVSPEVFHRFMNQAVGLSIGRAKVYEELANGTIRSLKIGNTYRIPYTELTGDYEARKLAESEGRPAVHRALLGDPV